MNRLPSWVFLLLIISVLAVSSQDREDAKLHIYLAPRVSSVCLGEKLFTLDVLVVNTGDRDMLLDTKRYGASVAVAKLATFTENEGRGSGTVIAPERPKSLPGPVRLKPGELFRTELSIPLSNPVFKEVGVYQVMPRIGFGSFQRPASPNEGVIFEMRACE